MRPLEMNLEQHREPLVSAVPTWAVQLGSSAAVSDHPSVFEHVFSADVNVCVWNRQQDPVLTTYLREKITSTSWERRAHIDVTTPRFDELLTGFEYDLGRVRWETELSTLVDLFATLTDSRTVGVRMPATHKSTCPRFHSDQVGLRLLCTWLGEGTEWMTEEDVIREPAEQSASGPIRPGGVIRHMQPFAVGILKGDAWPGNQGRGAIHRSPQPGEPRLFVSLDEL